MKVLFCLFFSCRLEAKQYLKKGIKSSVSLNIFTSKYDIGATQEGTRNFLSRNILTKCTFPNKYLINGMKVHDLENRDTCKSNSRMHIFV